jgi:hypothetical protein
MRSLHEGNGLRSCWAGPWNLREYFIAFKPGEEYSFCIAKMLKPNPQWEEKNYDDPWIYGQCSTRSRIWAFESEGIFRPWRVATPDIFTSVAFRDAAVQPMCMIFIPLLTVWVLFVWNLPKKGICCRISAYHWHGD